jgi:hypothetical protein
MTGRDLVSSSLRLLGVLASGEAPSAAEAVDGLSAINRMLDSWSTEGLMIYSSAREEFTLTAGVSAYTMGVGATFNTSRPQKILRAALEMGSNPAIEYPMRILTVEQWADIVQKTTQSTIPTDIYPEGTYPNETLNLYPAPDAAQTLVLYSWKPLSQIATLNTAIELPPGYQKALVYNGAVELAPEYGKMIPDAVSMGASESKATLKRMNARPYYLKVDPALVNTDGTYNIYRGDTT